MPRNLIIVPNFGDEMFYMGGYLCKYYKEKNKNKNFECDILTVCGCGEDIYTDGVTKMATAIRVINHFNGVIPKWLPITVSELIPKVIPQIKESITKMLEENEYQRVFIPTYEFAPNVRTAFNEVFKDINTFKISEIYEYTPFGVVTGENGFLKCLEEPEHNVSLFVDNNLKEIISQQYLGSADIPDGVYQEYEYYNLVWKRL